MAEQLAIRVRVTTTPASAQLSCDESPLPADSRMSTPETTGPHTGWPLGCLLAPPPGLRSWNRSVRGGSVRFGSSRLPAESKLAQDRHGPTSGDRSPAAAAWGGTAP